MTKKPRNTKKPAPKTNACWDELNQLNQRTVEMVAVTARSSSIFRDKEALSKVVNVSELYVQGELLLRDLNELNLRVNAIKAKHVNCTGGTNDPDQNMVAIQIGTEYNQWMEDYLAVIIPTVNRIDELINEVPVVTEPADTFANDDSELGIETSAPVKPPTPAPSKPAIDLMALAKKGR